MRREYFVRDTYFRLPPIECLEAVHLTKPRCRKTLLVCDSQVLANAKELDKPMTKEGQYLLKVWLREAEMSLSLAW